MSKSLIEQHELWICRTGLAGVFLALPVIALAQLPIELTPAQLPSNLPINGSMPGVNMATTGSANWRPLGVDELPEGFVDGIVIEQETGKVEIDWDEFHIQSGHLVEFDQPDSSSVALNRIHGSRTEIHGTLIANGRVYLVNSNGVLFGNGARVNVSQLVASTLDIPEAAFNAGDDINAAINQELAYFDVNPEGVLTEDQIEALQLGGIDVHEGAIVAAAEGGRIILVAPEINNEGTLVTNRGQILLIGARDKAYLAHSDSDPDSAGRSYLAEVGIGGEVNNSGQILANQSNVTMVGRAINQSGRVTATTSLDWNGTIRLVARDGAELIRSTTIASAAGNVDALESLWGFNGQDERPSEADFLPVPTQFSDDENAYQVNFSEGSVTEVVAHGARHDVAHDLAAAASSLVTAENISTIAFENSAQFSATDPEGNALAIGLLDDPLLVLALDGIDLDEYLDTGQLLSNVQFVTSESEYAALSAAGDVDPVLLDAQAVNDIFEQVKSFYAQGIEGSTMDVAAIDEVFADSQNLRNIFVERLVNQSNFSGATSAQAQPLSEIRVSAENIFLRRNSRVAAKGGEVFLLAYEKPLSTFPALLSNQKVPGGTDDLNGNFYDEFSQDDSLILMEEGSEIDVSGYHITGLPMSDNLLEFSVQTADVRNAPLQRGGLLIGETIYVNLLNGTDIDIVDLSPYLAAREETVSERLTAAGTIDIRTPGSFIQEAGSRLDISGGSFSYEAGTLVSTQLVYEGRLIDISRADPNLFYSDIYGVEPRNGSDRWQPTQWSLSPLFGNYYEAFTTGQDAGVLQLQVGRETRLSGDIAASSFQGIYQRDPTAATVTQARRSGTQMARRGQLLIDIGAVQSGEQNIWIGNELEEDEEDQVSNLVISPELLSSSGAGQILLATNGTIEVADNAALNLTPGTELTLQGNESVTVAGEISSAGGGINLITRTDGVDAGDNFVMVGESALIDVSGLWINDVLDSQSATTLSGKYVDGGYINVEATDSLILASGSQLLANGGALLNTAGQLKAGTGGDISITAPGSQDFQQLIVDAELQSFAIEQGGTLSLHVPSVFIGNASEVAAVRSDKASSLNNGLVLEDSFFSGRGFSAYDFQSSLVQLNRRPVLGLAEIVVAEGADIMLSAFQYNVVDGAIEGSTTYSTVATGARLNDFLSPTRLEEAYYRAPVDLSLTAATNYAVINDDLLEDAGGAFQVLGNISTENGGDIRLQSDHSIYINGSLMAPGGDIYLETTAALGTSESAELALRTQAIWLGGEAHLSTVSNAIVNPDSVQDRGGVERHFAEVPDSGSINLLASRGYIIMDEGAVMDVSGNSAQALIPQQNPHENDLTVGTIYGQAGSIQLTGTEGILIAGELRAHSANTAGSGGELSITMSPDLRDISNDVDDQADAERFNFWPASIRITAERDNSSQTGLAFGDSITDWLENISPDQLGSAWISQQQIEEGGFDRLSLLTMHDNSVRNVATTLGRVQVEAGVDLELAESLVIDTTTISYIGGSDPVINTSRLAAPNMLLGRSSARPLQQEVGDLTAGVGEILFDAALADASSPVGQIVMRGNLGIDNVDQVIIRAGNSIAVQGYEADSDANGLPDAGELSTWGDLTLEAAQIYPASYHSYTFSVLDDTEGRISTLSSGGLLSDLFVLAGNLTMNASEIYHQGVILAPMGTITLNATERLVATEGSILSVAPAEETIGGFIEGRSNLYYGFTGTNVTFAEAPEPVVSLNAGAVELQEGSEINVSGGGDALFYQFAESAGGAVDILDVAAIREDGGTADYFAIIPAANLTASPYDSAIAADSADIPLGQTVYLTAGAGVPEGEYAILPARYAMLEGAYLITPVEQSQAVLPGVVQMDTAGTPIVAGYLGNFATDSRPSDWQAFKVESGEVAYLRSGYTTISANQWFAELNAADAGSRRLPLDAGRLAVEVQDRVQLDGDMLFDSGEDTFNQIINDDILVISGVDNPSESQVLAAAENRFQQILDRTQPFGFAEEESYGYTLLETQGAFVIRRLTVLDGEIIEDNYFGANQELAATAPVDDNNPIVSAGPGYVEVNGVLGPERYTAPDRSEIERNLTVFREVTIHGNGGDFDLAAPNINIVSTQDPEVAEAEVLASLLDAMGAESILIGGIRQYDLESGRMQINTIADTVDVAAGSEVATQELLLTARNVLTVESGASLLAQGDGRIAGEVLAVEGDGALLRIAAGGQGRIVRDNISEITGSLFVEEGATLNASGGALLFDATNETEIDGELVLDNASLNISSVRVNLGDTSLATDPDSVEGLVLTLEQLNAFQLNELVLTSQSVIDLYGSFDFNGSNLVLQGAGIRRASDLGSENVSISASESLTLSNPGAVVDEIEFTTLDEGGVLALSAPQLNLGEAEISTEADFTIAGFTDIDINAGKSLILHDLNMAAGLTGGTTNLNILTPQITASRAADFTLAVSQHLAINGLSDTEVVAEENLNLAARAKFQAGSLQLDNGIRFDLPGGNLQFLATADSGQNNLVVGDTSFDLAGRRFDFGVAEAFSDAGSLSFITRAGDLTLSEQTVIDLSATQDASQAGGSLVLSAAEGNVEFNNASINAAGGADNSAMGGSLRYVAKQIAEFTGLNALLDSMGFDRARHITAAEGDLMLDADGSIAARDVTLTAEQGRVSVAGTVGYSTEQAGDIEIFAQEVLIESSAKLIASSTVDNGGNVMLTGAVNGVTIEPGALIDVTPGSSTARGGDIRVRAPVGATVRLDGDFLLSDVAADSDHLGRFYVNVLTRLNASDNDAGLFSDYVASIIAGDYELTADEVYAALDEAELNRQAFDDSDFDLSRLTEYRGLVADLELVSEEDIVFNDRIDIDLTRGDDLDLSLLPIDGSGIPDFYFLPFARNEVLSEGHLSIRSAGNVVINDVITDGFVADVDLSELADFAAPALQALLSSQGINLTLAQVTENLQSNLTSRFGEFTQDFQLFGDSWGISITAGSNVTSNNFRSIAGVGTRSAGTDIVLNDYGLIRTGSGDLFLAAAGNVFLGENAAVYTAGRATGTQVDNNGELSGIAPLTVINRTGNLPYYGDFSGDLTIVAGRDYESSGSNQFYTNWFQRFGNLSASGSNRYATAWLVLPAYFEQGIASFGGGGIDITVGGDAINLAVSSPTEAKYIGVEASLSSENILDNLQLLPGGDIEIKVAGDLMGASVFIGDGSAKVDVGGDILESSPITVGAESYTGLGFIGAVMGGGLSIQAAGDVVVETVFNPTVLVQSSVQTTDGTGVTLSQVRSNFFTYSDTSSFDAVSLGGNVNLLNESVNIEAIFSAYDAGSSNPSVGLNFTQLVGSTGSSTTSATLQIYPTQVSVTALGGDLQFSNDLILFPNADNDLDLLAYNNLKAINPTGVTNSSGTHVSVSFIDPEKLPSISNPSQFVKAPSGQASTFYLLDYFIVPNNATTGEGRRNDGSTGLDITYTWFEDFMPESPLHADSDQTFTIAALTGDITKDNTISQFNWFLPAQTHMRAGGDIDSVSVDIYHGNSDGTQLSSIEAGGDIRFMPITVGGVSESDNGRFNIHGSGDLWVASEGDISLGTSRGIRSLGNSFVFNMPSSGADVTVLAGAPLAMDLDFFYESGLPETYSRELANYVTADGFTVPLSDAVTEVTGESYTSENEARKAYQLLDVVVQRDIAIALLRQSDELVQKKFAYQVFFEELNNGGLESVGQLTPATEDIEGCASGYARSCNVIDLFFPQGSFTEANIDMVASTIQTRFGGDLNLLVPGGAVEVGVSSGTVNLGDRTGFNPVDDADKFGLLAFEDGRINIFTRDNVNVAESRIATLAGGRVMIYSETGSIDAGRGARTAGNNSSYSILEDGTVVVPKQVSGSGIRVSSAAGLRAESVNLWAPAGVIDAGEAGISSDGAVFLGAQSVFNADQISAEGDSVGVPDTSGAGGALEALSGVTSAATSAASESLTAETSAPGDAEATLSVRLLGSARVGGEYLPQPTMDDQLEKTDNGEKPEQEEEKEDKDKEEEGDERLTLSKR